MLLVMGAPSVDILEFVKHKMITLIDAVFKAFFSFHKIIPKNIQMTTLYTNLSLYITFTFINYIRQDNFVNVSLHYLTSGGYHVFL